MSVLRFEKSEVLSMLAKCEGDRSIMVVGDDGVYLLPDGKPGATTRPDPVYAFGIQPDKNEDTWWEEKSDTFGGDDGADQCATADELRAIVKHTKGIYVTMDITSDSMQFRV